MSIERELRTARLTLRAWRGDDARELLPILEANQAHFGLWIPTRVSQPVPLPLLQQRLDGFATAFSEDREWRFAIVRTDDETILGELDLFPRDAGGRIAFTDSDRCEIGYWLRSDETGRGFVLEAARAVLAAAARLERFQHAEIRCDPRNAPSVAVAERLGFVLAQTIEKDGGELLQIWTSPLTPFAD